MKKEMIDFDVYIPTSDEKGVAEKITIQVEAVFDALLNDYVLDGSALEKIDQVKARYMGLLLPEEIKKLRTKLGMTQDEMTRMLQIGEKTWSRWETGRDRPSRSMNLLLRSLCDGELSPDYLSQPSQYNFNWYSVVDKPLWQKFEPYQIEVPLYRSNSCKHVNEEAVNAHFELAA